MISVQLNILVVNRIILIFSVEFPLFFECIVLFFEQVIKMEKKVIANKLKAVSYTHLLLLKDRGAGF